MATAVEIKHHLLQILKTSLGQEHVVEVPLGTGHHFVGRLRVEMSKVRTNLTASQKKIARFKILAEVLVGYNGTQDKITFKRTQPGSVLVDLSEFKKLLQETEASNESV